jgi:hypothetical protein
VNGFDEQIKALRVSDAYLFGDEADPTKIGNPGNGQNPASGGAFGFNFTSVHKGGGMQNQNQSDNKIIKGD